MLAGCAGLAREGNGCTHLAEFDGERVAPLPDPPADRTAETVGEFVTAYEKAYRRNQQNVSDPDRYDFGIDARVKTADGGHLANLSVGFVDRREGLVGDGSYVAGYYLDESAVRRTQASRSPAPDPREGSVVVRCE